MSKKATGKRPPRKPQRAPRPAVVDANQLYNVPEASAALDQSHVTTYAMINRGELKSILRGRRRHISGAEIIRLSSGEA
jgi:hypothetical protein